MAIDAYHLGLPLWGERAWTGSLYSEDARPGDYLEQYARVFNAVEGNSTFYSPPSPSSVDQWREQTPESFRFCFKMPRALRAGDPGHPDVAAARHKKPNLPVEPLRTGAHGFVRLVCHPERNVNDPWFEILARTVSTWIDDGARPFVFVHCADNRHAPPLARMAHEIVARRASVGALPSWPGSARENAAGQLSML